MTAEAFLRAWPSGIGFVVARPGDPHPPNLMGAPASLLLTPSGPALRTAVPAIRQKGRL
jgi:hypothetical protein